MKKFPRLSDTVCDLVCSSGAMESGKEDPPKSRFEDLRMRRSEKAAILIVLIGLIAYVLISLYGIYALSGTQV